MRLFHPVAKSFVVNKLGIHEAGKNTALERIKSNCEQIEKRLADGRKYLLGNELSYIDIVWASSLGLMLFPEEYTGGQLEPQSLCSRAEFPEAMMSEMTPVLERPAGQFCLRLYKEDRGKAYRFQS